MGLLSPCRLSPSDFDFSIRRTVMRTRTALALVAALAAAGSAEAADLITPPAVPANLQVPGGNTAFLAGAAYGTQNYVCLPTATGFSWTLFGPQATLFSDDMRQIITHYLSPNPVEGGTPRATWRHSLDTSAAWALAIANSTDPLFVAPDSIPWLLLRVVGTQLGPTGGDRMTQTTFIHRVGTVGGLAPAAGCAQAADVGKKALVPYQAEYVFYRDRN